MITLELPEIKTGLHLEQLYEETFPRVARFVKGLGGGFEDAKDIFQDALVVYYEKQVEYGFQFVENPRAYLIGISKHLWIRRHRKDRVKIFLSDYEQTLEIPDNKPVSISTQNMMNLLQQSGQKCMQLLKAFYYDKLSMKQIRDAFGYGSERSATVQKYKCIEKIRSEVQAKTLTYEDFFE